MMDVETPNQISLLDQEAHEQCVVVGCREHQGITPATSLSWLHPQRLPAPAAPIPVPPQYLPQKQMPKTLLGKTQGGEFSFPQLSCSVTPGAPQATCITPEEGIAGEICKNYSAVITLHSFRAGNMK